jgi:flagellar biosynthesis component FlhA
MPEEKKKDSKEEIRKTLEGLLAAVEKRKATPEGKSGSWGWVAGLILSVLVFVALAFAAWQMWKKGKEIAKLKHKVDVDKEKEEAAKAAAEVAKSEEEREKLEREALRLSVKVEAKKRIINWFEKERKDTHAKIDAVTSWEELDELTK